MRLNPETPVDDEAGNIISHREAFKEREREVPVDKIRRGTVEQRIQALSLATSLQPTSVDDLISAAQKIQEYISTGEPPAPVLVSPV